MAQFRVLAEGSGQQVSRLGGKSSGVSASVDGWDVGFDSRANYAPITKRDWVSATLTGGSHGGNDKLPKIHVVADENGSYQISLNNKIIAKKGDV